MKFAEMTIDHIIPERLEDEPEELRSIRIAYQLDVAIPNFAINDYCNWVPAHGPGCNYRKGRDVLSKGITLIFLHQVGKKAKQVKEEVAVLTRNNQREKILATLGDALGKDAISEVEINTLLRQIEDERTRCEPLLITLGIEDVLSNQLPVDSPNDYVSLCDWLEQDLKNKFREVSPYSFHYTEASHRDGITLSVRLVCPELQLDNKDALNLSRLLQVAPWWEVLELTNFFRIYGATYQEEFG